MFTQTSTSQILDRQQILQKIKRIAFQIFEQNFTETELLLAGVHENGYVLAEMIATELRQIAPLQVTLLRVRLNKQNPLQQPVQLEPKQQELKGKVVILVDDVSNTGKTLAYGLLPFLQAEVKKVEIATLIDRKHPLFPVTATYTGHSLATTLQEHVEVVLTNEEQFGAYLV